MRNLIRALLGLTVIAMATGPAAGALLLSLDARFPGASPTTQWVDLSGVNAPFVGANVPVYNAGSQVYEYGRGAQIQAWRSVGADEGNFDFPASNWNQAPNPAGEFTLVAYLDNTGYTANTAFWSKGSGTSSHQNVTLNASGGSDQALMEVGVGNQPGNRAIAVGTGPAAVNALDLYVFHFNGRGAASDWDIYVNGGTTDISGPLGGAANMGDGPYLGNANQLYIGSGEEVTISDNRFFGDIQRIEVYSGPTIDNNLVSGMSPADYSAYRNANLGATVLPEPATLGLLLLGGLCVGRRGRRSA